MKDEILLELSNEIGMCSGGVASILEPHYQLTASQLDAAILENVAFLLAYLCYHGGLSLDEAGSCIACFVGINMGNDKDVFMHIAASTDFYLKQFLRLGKNDIFVISCICFNLLRPNARNAFDKSIPLGDVNFFKYFEIWTQIYEFINGTFSSRINPIIEKIRHEQ